MKVKILDRCNVAPSQQSAPQPSSYSQLQLPAAITSLPLTFFDIPWLFFPPSQPLFFYDYPHSTLHFISSVFPLLKASLSLALRSFFPFAGSFQMGSGPLKSPALVCSGDLRISLTIAESMPLSGDDFDGLVSSKFPRESVRLQSLVPSLLAPGDEEVVPLMAVQITAFSGCGFSVGIAYHHVAADERTFNKFLKSWTSFCRFAGTYWLLTINEWLIFFIFLLLPFWRIIERQIMSFYLLYTYELWLIIYTKKVVSHNPLFIIIPSATYK